jgi:hypothetical protein
MPHIIHMSEQAQTWLLVGGVLLIVFAVVGFLVLPQVKGKPLEKPARIGLASIGVILFFVAATANTAPEQPSPSANSSSRGTPSPSPTSTYTEQPSPSVNSSLQGTPSASPTFAYIQEEIQLEGEDETGDGKVMPRSAASQQITIWLHKSESRRYQFKVVQGGQYRFIVVRYSNDNTGPLEHVTLKVDKFLPVQFTAQDTGNYGHGWNMFKSAPVKALGSPNLKQGTHSLTISVAGGMGTVSRSTT